MQLEFPEKSGIYAIINIVNDKHYVGSAVNFINRKQNHISALKRNAHKNPHLQTSWNAHWHFNFIFVKLECCEKDKLVEREQWWIDNIKPEYNACPIAGRRIGYVSTEETKAKISKALKGKKKTDEHVLNAVAARKNYKHSEKTKAKIRVSWIGRDTSNLGRKKSKKWPHELGYNCKCIECKNKRNEYSRNWKAAKNVR